MSETSENDSSEEFYDAEDLTVTRYIFYDFSPIDKIIRSNITIIYSRKRASKSGTPQTSSENSKEFKFPEPLPPPKSESLASARAAETQSLCSDDATQKMRNISLRGLDSISEAGRRNIGAAPPTVLEVKSSVGVR